MFLVEGGVVGLVGGFLGMVIGGLIVVWFYEHGIDLSEPLENVASGNVPLGAMLYPAIDPFWWLIAPWFATLVATGASVYPAHMASRMSPADAVRG
jgi:putative ABC transport system permease protein